jgi:hypothetical protein
MEGWANPITILVDTGSEVSYISRKVARTLSTDVKVRSAAPIRVRLTNGDTTISNETLSVGLTIGDFRTRTSLRILDWNAYDVILGLDWLKLHQAGWDFVSSA